MFLSSCDIGNPIYEKKTPVETVRDYTNAIIFFDGGNRELSVKINFEYEVVLDGISVTCEHPEFIGQADNVEEDVRYSIEQETGKKIVDFSWM